MSITQTKIVTSFAPTTTANGTTLNIMLSDVPPAGAPEGMMYGMQESYSIPNPTSADLAAWACGKLVSKVLTPE